MDEKSKELWQRSLIKTNNLKKKMLSHQIKTHISIFWLFTTSSQNFM